MEVFIFMAQFLLPIMLIALALIAGKAIETRHFKTIQARETATEHIPIINARTWDTSQTVAHAELAQGSVVVSIDYFKRFMGGLYNLVGGRVRSFESVLDRGRREAILRMKASCPDADAFVNLRMERSILASTTTRGQYLGGIEVLAYSTAVWYQREDTDEVRTAEIG